MKLILLWNEQTDYASEVRSWLRDFESDNPGKEVEELDPETAEGADFARLYDIMQYPAIVAVDGEGRLLQIWKGTPLPQIEQVAFWARD